MMLTHKLVDQFSWHEYGNILRGIISKAVQFDCGRVDLIPIYGINEICEARPPFNTTLLQFEIPDGGDSSHAIVLVNKDKDGGMSVATFSLGHDGRFITAVPIKLKNGVYDYRDLENESYPENYKFALVVSFNFFYVLGCSNVGTVTHPAQTKLNKKRAKAGKYPLLEYKTLALKLEQPRSAGGYGLCTHASPRVHLRRGHVRRLESGKRVWVQPCVVGSNHGMVLKDYKVTHAAPAMH